jgi:hypothetical protein
LLGVLAQAAVIPLTNADFELPVGGTDTWDDVPGWTGDSTNGSGTDIYFLDGSRGFSAVLNFADTGVFQTTGYQVQPGDSFTFSFEAVGLGDTLQASLYYLNDLAERVTLVNSVFQIQPTLSWPGIPYESTYVIDDAGASGRFVGIEFDDITAQGNNIWFDNVTLSVVAVPEPGAVAMIAIAFTSLLALRSRRSRTPRSG